MRERLTFEMEMENLGIRQKPHPNVYWFKKLGWGQYIEQILQVLGLNITRSSVGNPVFVDAVKQWQAQQGDQNPNGVIDPKTWAKMHSSLSSNPTPTFWSNNPAPGPAWIEWRPSPNFESREGQPITAIVYHFTVGASLEGTVSWFRNRWIVNKDGKIIRGPSAHFVIGKKDGQIVQMVSLDKSAWHAGKAILTGRKDVNRFSIGIEIVNWGQLTRQGDQYFTHSGKLYRGEPPTQIGNQYWEPYTEAQYQALIRLTKYLITQVPTITHITGHEHIALPRGRKIDPGKAFNWDRIRNALGTSYQGHIGKSPI